jgi:hypothetical protein
VIETDPRDEDTLKERLFPEVEFPRFRGHVIAGSVRVRLEDLVCPRWSPIRRSSHAWRP